MSSDYTDACVAVITVGRLMYVAQIYDSFFVNYRRAVAVTNRRRSGLSAWAVAGLLAAFLRHTAAQLINGKAT